MRLLLDEMMSPKLGGLLAGEGWDIVHVRELGLGSASDDRVWAEAKAEGRLIITKDDDFRRRVVAEGPPPKVVLITTGNQSASFDAETLQRASPFMVKFAAGDSGLLVLLRPDDD